MHHFRLPTPGAGVTELWPSPAGDRLAVALADSDGPFRLWFWDLAADRPGGSVDLADDARDRFDQPPPAVSPDWRLMTVGNDLLRLVDPDRWVTLGAPFGMGEYERHLALDFTPDGATVYGLGDGFVDRWDVRGVFDLDSDDTSPAADRLRGGSGGDLAVSPAGTELAVTAGANVLRWRLPDHTPLPRVRIPPRLGDAGRLAYSPDGRTLAVAARKAVLLCDTDVEQPRRTLPGYARSLAFTPDGGRLLTTAPDGRVAVWDVADGTPRERYAFAEVGPVWEVAVAADGLTAFAGGADGRLVRWDL